MQSKVSGTICAYILSILQKMEILPVTDLGMALHDFVSKDDKQAFYSCVQLNLDDTQVNLLHLWFSYFQKLVVKTS